MVERIWDEFLTERDKQVFIKAGYGQRAGFGERPALIVIDVNYNFCGDKSAPILDSMEKWPIRAAKTPGGALMSLRRC